MQNENNSILGNEIQIRAAQKQDLENVFNSEYFFINRKTWRTLKENIVLKACFIFQFTFAYDFFISNKNKICFNLKKMK